MDPIHIADIEKNKSEVIRIEISEFKEKKYINIRTWYRDKETSELKPSQKGVAVNVDKYSLLKDAILKIEEFL